jgi:uncharacterized metal-binding protein
MLSENTESEIICPVFYRIADAKYSKLAQEKPLLVIDGCSTRCASKLAAEKNLKIAEKINITEEAKTNDITLSSDLRIGENELKLVKAVADKLTKEEESVSGAENSIAFPESLNYEIYKKTNLFSEYRKIPDSFSMKMMCGLMSSGIRRVSESRTMSRKAFQISCFLRLQQSEMKLSSLRKPVRLNPAKQFSKSYLLWEEKSPQSMINLSMRRS